MSSQQGNNLPTTTTTTQGVEPTLRGAAPNVGAELLALKAAVDVLQRGFEEGASGIPAQEHRIDPTVQRTGDDDDDDDEYNSDDSDDSPPPSMSGSMLERGEGNQVKVGVRTTATGEEVKKDTK